MRLDQWLFEKAYFDSREKSRREILAGRVREKGSGRILDKPGLKVDKDLEVEIIEKARFVSRAGEKLDEFLEYSKLSPSGKICLDVGSSTGGFTDCLLQRGAKQVVAVDVGTHQLHEKLRNDPRVLLFEQTDIRDLDFSKLPQTPDWVTVDVSFISIRKFLPLLVTSFPQALFILLFKPQFEAGRFARRKKGVLVEEERKKSLEEMLLFLRELGLNPIMVRDSAVKGMKGNQETFIVVQKSFPQSIFRTYDIRGHAATQLSDSLFEKLGFVLGNRVCELFSGSERPKIGIGRDARESSPRLYQALKKGLSQHRVHIFDLGLVTTPMLYFANYQFGLQGAFQITASHNPSEDNGLKMMLGNNTLFGAEIQALGKEVEMLSLPESFDSKAIFENGEAKLEAAYLEFLKKQFSFQRKFRIVLDCGNGMAGKIARRVFEPLCEDLHILYEEVDCRFPNHPADPTVGANLQDLIESVRKEQAEMGFAFDGDADRLGVVTAKGRILWGDEILMLLSEKVLAERPGAPIIGEVKCSEKLFRRIRELGGEPVMYKTGHSLIKKRMREIKAPIAGEMSGHLFFADRYFGFDDAIYAALRVMECVESLNINLDEWIEQFPAMSITPEMRVECQENEKEALVSKVIEFFSNQPDLNLNLIDGVRVSFPDGAWALVRASNTQAVLVVRIEAPSESRIQEIKASISRALGREF